MRGTSGSISGRLPLPSERPTLGHLAGLHWGLLASALALAAVGLLVLRSASAEAATDYFSRQLVWAAIGFVAMLLTLAFDYHRLLGLSPLAYAAGLVSLVLVLFVGHEAGGAVGWFRIGSVGIQPSEFAKLATALFLARYLAGLSERRLDTRHILTVLAIAAAPMLLTAVEPDLGGAGMFAPMVAGMLLVAGVRARLVVGAVLGGLLVGALIWNYGMKSYQRDRIITFLAPAEDPLGAGYHITQSKIAIGSGGIFGKGFLNGTQSHLHYLPEQHTDFIFPAMAEEWGLAGGLFDFVVAHGCVELSCICIAGAAGAYLGESLVRPRERTRAEAFRAASVVSIRVMVAVTVLLFICGFIEGYVSPDPDVPRWARVTVGVGYWIFMISFLRGYVFGRSRGGPPIRS